MLDGGGLLGAAARLGRLVLNVFFVEMVKVGLGFKSRGPVLLEVTLELENSPSFVFAGDQSWLRDV